MVAGFYFMKKIRTLRKTLLIAVNLALDLLLAVTGSFVALSSSIMSAGSNVNYDADFLYTDSNGHKYKCYERESADGEVEIAWGGSTDEDIEELNVPSTVSNGVRSFDVTSVAQGGFRYCKFGKINLPDTIVNIEEEAFAYCVNITEFVLPYGVTEIKNSTFIDCRSMVNFFYKNSSGVVSVTNDKVTSVGDHAFNNCVALNDFTCSTKLTYFGKSCFKNCNTLTRFYFPSKTETENNITVESYAFADCSNLEWVYFEENMHFIDDYAFVDCLDSMVFHYGYEGEYPGDPEYTQYWRRKRLESNNTAIYKIIEDHIVILQSNEYPGLKYTIEDVDRYLDCSQSSNSILVVDGSKGKYAVTYQWVAPSINVPNYWNPTTGALEIPGSLTIDGHEYPLKVINVETFKNKPQIKSVKFNSGLVQICRRAFVQSDQITSLDFTDCDTLIEISNSVFNECGEGTTNEFVTSLTLPNSVQYIGSYAFYAFRKVSHLSFKVHDDQPGSLKVLGGYSFGRLGEFYKAPTVDVVLPCTLDDSAAVAANINAKQDYETGKENYNSVNWAAVGPYVFGAEKKDWFSCVRSITMEECTHYKDEEHPENGTIHEDAKCSLAPNAFNRATYVYKFVSSSNLYMIGNEVFKNNTQLRECFLSVTKAAASGKKYPWGTKYADGNSFEKGLFTGDGSARSELVIYLNGDEPGQYSTITNDNNTQHVYWNAEYAASYVSDFGWDKTSADVSHNRSHIPTYTIDDFTDNSVLYWKPNKTGTGGQFVDAPVSKDDYESGIIALAKTKGQDEYTVVRYFTKDGNRREEIDLSLINDTAHGNISSKIKTIGDEAFGRNDTKHLGLYFILPDCVETISERAFYRMSTKDLAKNNFNTGDNVGVRIVTYRTGGVVQPSQAIYDAAKQDCATNAANNAVTQSYCSLPSGLKKIGRNAFYNNLFCSVSLGANLEKIGIGAFFTQNDVKASTVRAKNSSMTVATNSNYEVINNGLYTKGASKTLLYQEQNHTGTLSVASGTLAIAMYACAGTGYSKISLNSSLKTIYGSAFAYNFNLEEVEGGEGLEYISAVAPGDELYSSSLPFDNIDFRDRMDNEYRAKIEAQMCAFQNCTKLSTINFKEMTNLKKIGTGAFRACTALEDCAGGDSYSYYKYDGSSTTLIETVTTGVIDLTPCENLKVIGREALGNSKKIKYLHLPYRNGDLSVGRDAADAPFLSQDNQGKIFGADSKPAILIGDNADRSCTKVNYTYAAKYLGSKWSNVWFGSSKVYYHVTPANAETEILSSGSVSDLGYWTEKDGGGYLLFDTEAAAEKYFNVRQ